MRKPSVRRLLLHRCDTVTHTDSSRWRRERHRHHRLHHRRSGSRYLAYHSPLVTVYLNATFYLVHLRYELQHRFMRLPSATIVDFTDGVRAAGVVRCLVTNKTYLVHKCCAIRGQHKSHGRQQPRRSGTISSHHGTSPSLPASRYQHRALSRETPTCRNYGRYDYRYSINAPVRAQPGDAADVGQGSYV